MVLLLINSCKKDGGNVPDLNEAINSSKQWFASTKINSYDPDWPNAKLLYENGNLFVAVPTNISYSSIDKLSSILIVDLNTDVITGGMVEFINSNRPIKDEDFVNLYNAISQNNKAAITNNYKGNILLFTPDRHFKLGWQMDRGEVTGLIKRANPRPNTAIEKSADLNRQLNKISQAVPDQPTCEDHYWVVYNPITFEIYSYRYLYSTCTDGDENQSGGGSTVLDNGEPIEDADPDLKADCNSWKYIPVGPDGDYQACGVTGIDLDYITSYMGNDGNAHVDYIYYKFNVPIYFEFPHKRANGVIVSPSEAAVISAQLRDRAEKLLEERLGGRPNPGGTVMENAYLEILSSLLAPFGARVSRTANYGNVPIKPLRKGFRAGGC